MATKTVKSRPGGPKVTVTRRPPRPRAAAADPAPPPQGQQAPEKAGGFLKRTLLPSAACGILLSLVALQEGASLAIAAVMAVCMTGVIAGMVKLKNALYGG